MYFLSNILSELVSFYTILSTVETAFLDGFGGFIYLFIYLFVYLFIIYIWAFLEFSKNFP